MTAAFTDAHEARGNPRFEPRMPQPQPKHSDYTEFLPQNDRRMPLPITHLPVTAIGGPADPTLEIRTLIEQLQQTARDARLEMRAAEQERDGLAQQLARAEQQMHSLRENERELRSHFVEVTSLIKERDSAMDESERRAKALAEATRKLEGTVRERSDAQRQRDDAIRQREEAARKLEANCRAADEQSRLIGETQKQLLAIRQARDGAHAQLLEAADKLRRAEDQAADLEYHRELAEKAAKQAAAEAAEYRRQLQATASDRDATAKQVEELTQELDAQRRKLLDLAEEKSAVTQADGEHAAALAEARDQVLSLSQERDAARARVQELAKELEELHAQFQDFRDRQGEETLQTLAEAHEKVAALEAQARDSGQSADTLRQELDAVNQQFAAAQSLSEAVAAGQAEIQRQLAAVSAERDAARTSVQAAQKQIDHIIRDRDSIRQLSTENALTLEAQIVALRAQAASFEKAATDAKNRQEDLKTLQKRFETQRVETIDIGTQLQTAQREIRELSANLAEARLQVKFATAATRATKGDATQSDLTGISPVVSANTDALNLGGDETLTERETRSALGAMRHCFQSFTKTPDDLSLLNELHCHVHNFSERARTTGFLAVHRLCAAFSELTRGLYDNPEQVNPSTLRTVNQTIEFLGSLMKDRIYTQARDPATALIYAVDDDAGNCDAIQLTMENSSMRTSCALEPGLALAELASAPYDLIFLDVNLPGMDGFELCRHIRELALHTSTPVVFLTGLATLENRVQSTLCGGNDFIAKPFNLNELSVKAMTLILRNQLQIA